jgi:phage FluMu protein Com
MPAREFLDVRCPTCRKLLCKVQRGALREDGAVEVKCDKCKKLVYHVQAPRAQREVSQASP